MRSYEELKKLETFLERFEYLKLSGIVGDVTFGNERYLNQGFYRSLEWKRARDQVILRDNGCDLGIEGREISGRLYVHHLNPVTAEDICGGLACLLDPDNMITVSHSTHNAIHYGDADLLAKELCERKPNDTCPWRK